MPSNAKSKKKQSQGGSLLRKHISGAGLSRIDKKLIDESMKSTERRFEQLLENSFDNIVVLDAAGIQRYVSKSVQRTLGYSPFELLNIPVIQEMIHPDDQKRVREAFQEIVTKGQGGGIQYRHKHKNGGWVDLECWGTNQLHNPDIQGIVINCRVITERKKAQEALMRESSFRSAIIENQPGMVWFKDKEGKFLEVNRQFAVACGFQDSRDIIGKTDLDIWPRELAEKYRADDQEVMRAKKSFRGEELINDKGSRKVFETFKTPVIGSTGEILGTSGFAQDVTDRKIAENALRYSEEKYRNLFNNAEVGMVRSRLDGSETLDVNNKYLFLFGWTRQEIISKPSKILWLDASRRDEMVRTIKDKGSIDSFECKILNKQGEAKDCLLSFKLYRETGILEGSIIDITERKRAEEEYRTILQTSMDSFYLVEMDGRIVDVNDSYCAMTGYSREELLRMSVKDLEAVESEAAIRKRIQEIRKTGSCRFESKHRHKDGGIIEIEACVNFLKSDKEKLFVFMRDITERKRAESHARQLKAIVESADDCIISKDLNGLVTSWNPGAEKMFDYSSDEMIGTSIMRLIPEDRQAEELSILERIKEGKVVGHFETVRRKKDGCLIHVSITASPIKDSAGHIIGASKVARDITDRKSLENKLEVVASCDALTQLLNRTSFLEKSALELSRAKRHNRQCAILFIDLDEFKIINDTIGHTVGDALLKDAALRLASCIRETDILARIGGDEFVVFLNDIENEQGIQNMSERILSQFNTPRVIADNDIFITASIGISVFPNDGDSIETLVKNADIAMYVAKGSGKNRFCFFDQHMRKNAMIRMEVERDLRNGLDKKEFTLHYQPIFSLLDGKVRGFEALIRWLKPGRGIVYPDEFISIAEETGLIVPMGEWVLHEACRFNKQLIDRVHEEMIIAVNVSVDQLLNKNLPKVIKSALDQSGLPAHLLEIEVTESLFIESLDMAVDLLNSIRGLGVQISLDDFGTGYSSLALLHKLPIINLKIDRSFINDIHHGKKEAFMVTGIISMAHELKLAVIAEGVETREQLLKLSDDNCDFGQGYFYSKPLKGDDVLPFMERVYKTDFKNSKTGAQCQLVKNSELLNDELVKLEIERHRWIESEKAGHDIGFEKASTDWLNRYSDMWLKYHQYKRKTSHSRPKH